MALAVPTPGSNTTTIWRNIEAYLYSLAVNGGGGGSGTVTSVQLALPDSIFSVSGGPVTTEGTLTGSLITQSANRVFAGPATGAPAAPTFRALVAADMVAAGNNTEVQFNSSGGLGATAGLTYSTGQLTVGQDAVTRGVFAARSDGVSPGQLALYSIAGGLSAINPHGTSDIRICTLPNADGTFVLDSSTQTLTGKTISGASNTLSNIAPSSITGTAAILGANTFTALQTITQASANAGIIASTGYSLTGSNATSMVDLTGTWDTTGTPSALKFNITDTASNAASLFADFQIASASVASIGKQGYFSSSVTGASGALSECGFRFAASGTGGIGYGVNYMFANGQGNLLWSLRSDAGFVLANSIRLGFSTDASFAGRAFLESDASNILAQKNTTNAQTLRVYGTFTDASNYVRASLGSTSTLVTLAAETAGSGGDNINIDLTAAGTGFVNCTGTTGLAVNGTKVLGAQGAAVADATDNPTAITQLNALLARLRTHGLIAT